MTDRPMQMSPGAVAEALGVSVAVARAAILGADLRDERGRPKTWFGFEDLAAIQAQLDGPVAHVHDAVMGGEPGEDEGTPEPVSAEDLEDVEQEKRRRKRR